MKKTSLHKKDKIIPELIILNIYSLHYINLDQLIHP